MIKAVPQQIKLFAYLAIAASLFASGWTINQWRWEAKYAEQVERARKDEQALQKSVDAIANKSAEEMRRIIRERDAAIDRLRNRPERMPEDSRANCKGATGSELARPDAEFLVWLSTQAEIQRQALKACFTSFVNLVDPSPPLSPLYKSKPHDFVT